MSSIACESRIDRVEIYSRGAVVQRAVTLPDDLPPGSIDLAIGDVTRLAELGSARAIVEGGRQVVSVASRLVVPERTRPAGRLAERLRELHLTRAKLTAERDNRISRREALAAIQIDPGLARRITPVLPEQRMLDALAIEGVTTKAVEALDDRLLALDLEIERRDREIEDLELEAAQADASEREGQVKSRIEIAVRLAPKGASDEPLRSLAVTYRIAAARWWPAYVARVTEGATRVALRLDAFVAQDSGEDWTRSRIVVSTADLARDTRLPELRSLRLGRAQPSPRRGYRPPPAGLDAMFAAYDRASAELPRGGEQTGEDKLDYLMSASPSPAERPMPVREKSAVDSVTRLAQAATISTAMPHAGPIGAAAAAPAGPVDARDEMQAMKPRSTRLLGGIGGMFREGGGAGDMLERRAELSKKSKARPAPEPTEIEPADAWLDFDGLTIVDAQKASRRGRLERDVDVDIDDEVELACARIEELEAPAARARDPREARGEFDHAYEAGGLADVPSNAMPHRLPIQSGDATGAPRFVTVPRDAPEVYREMELKNPFDSPLLGGPVEIFLDGALLTSAEVERVDRGGTMHLGLGVEDRLRVARNVRVEETTTGLLGGTTAVDHAITIDLSSALGRAVAVEVFDRIPITDDKEIEVKTTHARPPLEAYLQTDRGEPIRKGVRWRVEVPAGGKTKIELGYRVGLPAKNEIVGGNRRD